VTNRVEMEIPWNGLENPAITQSNAVSAASISTSYSEITQTLVQEASGDGVEWEQHGQQIATVKQGGAAGSSASQANLVNLAGWTGTLVTPPGVSGERGTGGVQSGGDLPVVETGLIFGSPPLTLPGLRAGRVHVLGVSVTRILTTPHGGPRALGVAGATSTPPAAGKGAPTTPVERFIHTLFNLLGAGSSAAVLLLGATPFAALLALSMIAALGVGRLQYAMPALGRSVDFARRERPG
jgi:hypothetical protein